MHVRSSALPALSAAAAAAWLIAQLWGSSWLAALVALFLLFGPGLVALPRREQSARLHLVLGLAAAGGIFGAVLVYLLTTEGGGTSGLGIMLVLAALLMLPVPLLYALTFPTEPGDAP